MYSNLLSIITLMLCIILYNNIIYERYYKAVVQCLIFKETHTGEV